MINTLNVSVNFIMDFFEFFGGSNITAFCALILTTYTIASTKKHNKLSVRPFLISALVYDPFEKKVCIDIRNVGSGTAYMESFELLFDGKPTSYTELNDTILKTELKGKKYNFSINAPLALQANSKFALISITLMTEALLRDDYSIIDRFSARIEYTCGYKSIQLFTPEMITKLKDL